jgi:hypothetical protein
MTAYEIAQMVRTEPYHTNLNRNVIADFIDKQADQIAELKKKLQESALDYISVCSQADEHYARLQELEFENKAFRKELFNIGSMRSCSYAAQHHGFVSPRQAGDDAREYIAEILEKAKTKECE